MTEFYDVERTITSLGTGEALVTALSPKGVPTALAATRLVPPDSMMAAIDEPTFRTITAGSLLATKYGQTDRPRQRPRDHHRAGSRPLDRRPPRPPRQLPRAAGVPAAGRRRRRDC